MKALRPLALVTLLAAVDLGAKGWAVSRLPPGRVVTLVPGLFDLAVVQNRGVALSTFADLPDPARRWLVLLVPAAVTAFVARLLVRLWDGAPAALRAGLVLVVGGALGNLVDRALDGEVIDFVRFRVGDHALFTNNLADDFISVGAVLLALAAARSEAPARERASST